MPRRPRPRRRPRTVRVVVEDWCAVHVLAPGEVFSPVESMTVLALTAPNTTSSMRVCAVVLLILLRRLAMNCRIHCLLGAMEPLRRLLTGGHNHPMVDAMLDPLFDLSKLLTATLLQEMPFTSLEIYFPDSMANELYEMLQPTPEMEEKLRQQVLRAVQRNKRDRILRHLARGRFSGKSYFNAA